MRPTIISAWFQFHNGSIKGHLRTGRKLPCFRFQFHNGSIKGCITAIMVKMLKFQFHNGSIKGKGIVKGQKGEGSFNSTMVRLKVWDVV